MTDQERTIESQENCARIAANAQIQAAQIAADAQVEIAKIAAGR